MEKLLRYQAYVDGKLIWDSNSVTRCKEKCDHELARNGFYAEIRTGKKIYASRLYDAPKWFKHN